jgi:hypothetical protein
MISSVSGKSADIIHAPKSRIADPCSTPPINPVINTGIASTAKYRALLITIAFVNGIERVNLTIFVSSNAALNRFAVKEDHVAHLMAEFALALLTDDSGLYAIPAIIETTFSFVCHLNTSVKIIFAG